MKPRALPTWLLLTLLSPQVQGQASGERAELPANSLGLVGGAIHYRLIDEAHTPRRLLLRGTNARFGLEYERVSNSYVLAISAAASGDYVHSKDGDWRSEFVALGLSLAYARQLGEYSLGRWANRAFLGLALDSDNYFLGDDQIPDNFDLLSVHGVQLELRHLTNLGDDQVLSMMLRIPAFVFVERRARGRYGDEPADTDFPWHELFYGGEVSVLPVTRFVTGQLEYRKILAPALAGRIRYRFRYCNVPVGVPYHLYSNELSLGLDWSF
jgi:hypothetical protein